MPKKRNNIKPRAPKKKLTPGQIAADITTKWVGSWTFIIGLLILMAIWIYFNTLMIINKWDPYPFILLNFVLSTLAAIQAPVILMSQNRVTERDRVRQEYDYKINRKAEREITEIQEQLNRIEKRLK